MSEISKFFTFFGFIFLLIGLFVAIFGKLGFPKMPGDIVIEGDNFKFFFPITTSIILSLILTILLNLFFRR
ncbi:MAG: DUF2905 family protein [Deltaproteobacteria bacterium]|nr:DUF2905 family protein [Deltaproteobacteria bacterium]